MFILDPNFFSIPDPGAKRFRIPDPKSASKYFFNPNKLFLNSRKYDTECSSRIRILIFYPTRIPDLGPRDQKGTESWIRIRNTGYWYRLTGTDSVILLFRNPYRYLSSIVKWYSYLPIFIRFLYGIRTYSTGTGGVFMSDPADVRCANTISFGGDYFWWSKTTGVQITGQAWSTGTDAPVKFVIVVGINYQNQKVVLVS